MTSHRILLRHPPFIRQGHREILYHTSLGTNNLIKHARIMVNTLTMLLEILLYKERLIIVQGDKK